MLLGKHSVISHGHDPCHGSAVLPADDDFIKFLDYDDLERRFEIHKYYPNFIHNHDYLTPQIREMISDKPIYAKANEHLKNFKNPGSRKTFITEIDVVTGQMRVHEKIDKSEKKEARRKERRERKEERKEEKRERRDEKREERKERKDERKERKDERKDERKERKDMLEDRKGNGANETAKLEDVRIMDFSQDDIRRADDRQGRHNARKEVIESRLEDHRRSKERNDKDSEEQAEQRKLLREHRSQRMAEKTSQPYVAPAIKPPTHAHTRGSNLEFNNPFDSRQPTLVASAHPQEGIRSRQNSVRTVESMESIKSTIGGRLRNLIRPRKVEDNGLVRTSSYDQTQSMMTSTRGAKNKLLRLKGDSGRRMSGQLGTYIFESEMKE